MLIKSTMCVLGVSQEQSGTKKRFLLEVRFCKNTNLSWMGRSEFQRYCWAGYPQALFISLGVTLDSAESPFAETPLSWFLKQVDLLLIYSFLLFWALLWGEVKPNFAEQKLYAHPDFSDTQSIQKRFCGAL